MTIWTIEPHDPLIVRDGRPFTPDPGARAVTLDFPFPSTTTGAIRSLIGEKRGGYSSDVIADLLAITIRGPLLVEFAEDNSINEWFVPTPADAVVFRSDHGPDENDRGNQSILHRLVPLQLPDGYSINLSDETEPPNELSPVGLPRPRYDKVAPMPRFWRWKMFEQWISNPDQSEMHVEDLGIEKLPRDERVQIARDPATHTARDGILFSTQGLSFLHTDGKHLHRLGLAIDVDTKDLAPDFLAPLGGERRLTSWHQQREQRFPQCPPAVIEQIIRDRHCRVILLTPAYFARGFLPMWLTQTHYEVSSDLRAIAIGRPEVVSGWNLVTGKPKPSRRLAPAGTVLFLALNGTPDTIREWIEQIWMHCISDDEVSGNRSQCRDDGFGLAVLGTWNGTLQPMEVDHA